MQEIRKLADKIACEFIMYPTDRKYTDEHIREFQGCPTIAATKGRQALPRLVRRRNA